jgi:hypothetical protein
MRSRISVLDDHAQNIVVSQQPRAADNNVLTLPGPSRPRPRARRCRRHHLRRRRRHLLSLPGRHSADDKNNYCAVITRLGFRHSLEAEPSNGAPDAALKQTTEEQGRCEDNAIITEVQDSVACGKSC